MLPAGAGASPCNFSLNIIEDIWKQEGRGRDAKGTDMSGWVGGRKGGGQVGGWPVHVQGREVSEHTDGRKDRQDKDLFVHPSTSENHLG